MTTKENIELLKRNPKIRLFLLFLFLSFVYWFFTSLSEKYTYSTNYNINYTNIPSDLFFQREPPKEIYVQIKATGFEILRQKIMTESVSFDVSSFKQKGKYSYYFETNKQLFSIQNQMKDNTINHFLKDSLIVFLGALKEKKVPVLPKVELSFKSGYKLTDNLLIQPDSILVKGPEQYIDSIKQIETNFLKKENISKDFIEEISLKLSNDLSNHLSFSSSEVSITAKVAKFTEGSIELPILLPEVPKGIQLELFPKTVIIKYEVTFENYQDVNADSFEISCDYPKENSQKKKVKLKLISKPNYIKNYSLNPNEVTYLIQYIK